MYGFKPKSARGKGPQQFAEGGLIRGPGTGTSDSIKTEKRPGTFIMPADSTQAITPEVLAKLGATEEMPEGAELGEDDQGEGGKVPVRLSNGEFELPPEQVQALGEAVLTVMRNATHQPAGEQGEAHTGKGFTPHQFFAGGGTVQDEERLKRINQIPAGSDVQAPAPPPVTTTADGKFDEKRVNANNPAGIGFADGGRVRPRGFVVGPGTETSDSIPARLSAGEYVLPADTVKAVGVDQLDALREATHKPVKGEGAKAARGFFAGGTPGGLDEAYKSWQDKKAPWYMPTPRGNMEERTAEAAYTQALRNSYSGNSSPSATGQPGGPSRQAAPAPDAAPSPAVQQQPASNASPAVATLNSVMEKQRRIDAINGTGAPPTTQPQTTTQPPANAPQEIEPGVYRHGRGQYSDNAAGMAMPPGFTGQPNAQNMAAADALVARQTPAGFQPAGSQPAGVQAPVVRNSTNDWAARNNLRNMEVSASSITNRPEWQSGSTTQAWSTRSNGVADPQGKVAAYRAAVANDQALQQAQPGMDKAALDANAALQREGTQQAGAITRTAMQEQGANAREAGRNALAQGEFGLKREAAGFQARAAAQQEQLRNTLIDPKATPEQRKQAQEYLQALAISGKEPSPQYKSHVMPAIRNADGSTTEGSVYQENTRTGEGRWVKPPGDGQAQQAMPKPASKAEFDALPKGTRFTDPNGQVRIK